MANVRVAALVTLLLAAPATAGDVDWWQVHHALDQRLIAGKSDLWRMAAQVGTKPATSAEQAWLRVIACVRTGRSARAVAALGHLGEVAPPPGGYPISRLYHELCDRYRDWKLAQHLLEAFEDSIHDVSLQNRLIKHWQEAGWSNGRIDAWLAARGPGYGGYWVMQRVRFRARCGTARALLDQLAETLRAEPADRARVVLFLDAAAMAHDGAQPPCDLGWMTKTLTGVAPLEASKIAEKLRRLSAHEQAVFFYKRALARPLTEEEVFRYGSTFQAVRLPAHLRHGFTAHLHDGLARSLLSLGRAAEAQSHIERAAAIREEHGLPQSLGLAGEVQAASGARTIEGRVRAQEKLREDDPRYWLDRADYYRGRKLPKEEERALERALALCSHEARARGKAPWPQRSRVVSHYERFLDRQGRTAEAVALLRGEIRDAPSESHAVEVAVSRLGIHYRAQLVADDPVCWTWLRRRPQWNHGEQRLLWEMLQKARGDEREVLLKRAENLADGAHPSRAHALGWILNRLELPRRSIAQLRDASARTEDPKVVRRATRTLFDSYLACGLWRDAEGVLADATAGMGTGELLSQYDRIAVCAARTGAADDALRFWRRRMAIDAMDFRGVDDLVAAELAKRLRAAYAEWTETHPGSIVGERAALTIRAAER
jgi:tetratricopeptide (TPR) repeat protein